MSAEGLCQLRVDPPQSGAVNMAIDEALLQSAIAGTLSLRFYQWAAPTISLGHFQAASRAPVPERFAGLEMVRRLSGGGAILHDRELTYSCGLPASHPLAKAPSRLYDLIHQAVIDELAARGIACRMRGTDAFADQSFLCFSRGDARDVVIGGQKILGSAQRRRQGAVLQHGSLLLEASPLTPEFPGLGELTGQRLAPEEFIPGLATRIVQRLELTAASSNFADWIAQLPL
jgi:lipoate-protein ligase A